MTSRILSVVLGLFYIASGIGKLIDVLSFYMSVYNYGVPEALLLSPYQVTPWSTPCIPPSRG